VLEQRHVGDPAALVLRDVDPVAHAADPHHVAALLVIGVGVEDVVRHVLEDRVQHLARHLGAVGVGIGHRGDVVDVLARDLLPRQDRRAPAEAGRQGDLRVALADQRVADHVVPGAVEIAAPVQERPGGADHLAISSAKGARLVDQRGHLRDRARSRPRRSGSACA
jgi:hypothetical protein